MTVGEKRAVCSLLLVLISHEVLCYTLVSLLLIRVRSSKKYPKKNYIITYVHIVLLCVRYIVWINYTMIRNLGCRRLVKKKNNVSFINKKKDNYRVNFWCEMLWIVGKTRHFFVLFLSGKMTKRWFPVHDMTH